MKKNDTNYISDTAQVVNSSLGSNVKIYKDADVRNSNLGDCVIVGDSTIVIDSTLMSNISINRRNEVFRSQVGKFTYSGINAMIRSCTVGNFCSLSWDVSIGGGDHPHNKVTTSTLSAFHLMDSGTRNKDSKEKLQETYSKMKPCIVGSDVLVSSHAVILRDLTVGHGAIIGAGAIVNKDVEPYSIVVGAPARKIKMRFDDKTIQTLLEIEWWNWPNDVIRNNLDLIYAKKVDGEILEKLKEISNTI